MVHQNNRENREILMHRVRTQLLENLYRHAKFFYAISVSLISSWLFFFFEEKTTIYRFFKYLVSTFYLFGMRVFQNLAYTITTGIFLDGSAYVSQVMKGLTRNDILFHLRNITEWSSCRAPAGGCWIKSGMTMVADIGFPSCNSKNWEGIDARACWIAWAACAQRTK